MKTQSLMLLTPMLLLLTSCIPTGDLYEFQELDEKIDAICSRADFDARIVDYGGSGTPLIVEIENRMTTIEGFLVELRVRLPPEMTIEEYYPSGSGAVYSSVLDSPNFFRGVPYDKLYQIQIDEPMTIDGTELNYGDIVRVRPIFLVTYDYTSGTVTNATGYGGCKAISMIVKKEDITIEDKFSYYCETDDDCILILPVYCGCMPCGTIELSDPRVIPVNPSHRDDFKCPEGDEHAVCPGCAGIIAYDSQTDAVCVNNQCVKKGD